MASKNKAQPEIDKVAAYPAKSFFVTMLTRDIELQDAILDLLDNCVDGALRSRSSSLAQKDSLKGYWAKITFNSGKFTIEDNCGGIPWDIAEKYAFCMGKPTGSIPERGTIGVVGIGMKRAIFKMGRNCLVHSNHSDDSFLVCIEPSWFEQEDTWTFDAEREKPISQAHGTVIEITDLTLDTQRAFKSGSNFRTTFEEMVSESYAYLIEKGFKVTVNETPIKGAPVRLCFEDAHHPKAKFPAIRPFVFKAKLLGVEVFLTVGYRSRINTPEEQDDAKEITFAAKEAGWTVVCNDRVVLSNDRSIRTGWGIGGVPNFHNQFSCIAGVVEFRSPNTALLPITTTKRGVDAGKDVYTIVRQKMQEGLKYFTRNTNRWKGSEAELKDRFDRAPYLGLHEIQSLSEKLPLNSAAIGGKQYKPTLPEKRKLQSTRRISFVREVEEINSVSRLLFDEEREPSEVGEACFERFVPRAKGR